MQYAVYLRKIYTPCNNHHMPPAKAPGLFPIAGVVCTATLRYSTHGQCMRIAFFHIESHKENTCHTQKQTA